MTDIKVSICMIVKNEEANLERCLDSFLPIIIEEWCELIVVDTGSTDRTIEVAKKHFAKVSQREFIPWSFGEARNYAISKCSGEKILILDADEELPAECLYSMKDVMLNPDYTQPTVFFTIRNIYSKDNLKFSYFKQPRLFLNDGTFRYEGGIHNKPIHKTPYLFAEHIYFNHYGYKWVTQPGLAEKKKDRALEPLLEQYRENPKDTHVLVHLTKTCRLANDKDGVRKYGEEFVEAVKDVKWHEGWLSYSEVFADLVELYLLEGDIENALRIKDEVEKYSDRLIDIYIMFGNYYVGQDTEKSVDYYERCIEIIQTKDSVYEDMVTSNAEMLLPKIYNYLAIYYYQRAGLETGPKKRKKFLHKAGQYLNDGIYSNTMLNELRWDIWNCADKIGDGDGDHKKSGGGCHKVSGNVATEELGADQGVRADNLVCEPQE